MPPSCVRDPIAESAVAQALGAERQRAGELVTGYVHLLEAVEHARHHYLKPLHHPHGLPGPLNRSLRLDDASEVRSAAALVQA
jgi:hypothetical protein